MSDISRLPAGPVSNTPQVSGTQKATIPETITPDLQAPVSPELPKTNDFFEADTQGNWFDNFPQATPNACMGEPAYIEVKPKTSAKLEELEKERTTLQNLAEANPLHPANTKKLADIGKARESANEAISRLRPPEEGAWYENNFITRANASVGRAALGFANDTVLGLAHMVQESAHKMPLIPGANVYGAGVEAAQQLNEYRIQQENLRLGNTTQEEISAQGKQQLLAMWDGLVEPISKPWNRGDYLEAVARGALEAGSLAVGVGEATAAVRGARAAHATNKAAVTTRAAETATVLKQTAKGAEGAGALGKPGQVKPISPGEVGGAGAKAIDGAEVVAKSPLHAERLYMQLAAEQAAGLRAPATIAGYSEHAMTQIAARDGGIGVNKAALMDAFSNPVYIQHVPSKYGPTFRYVGRDATVVLNPQGTVVTAWGTTVTGVAK